MQHIFSRRNFLKLSGLGITGFTMPGSLFNKSMFFQNNKDVMMYIGTYTDGKSEGIYLYKLNTVTGELTHAGTTKGVSNPSFLAIDPKRKFLFAVNEISEFEGKKSGAVSAFAINQQNGELTFLNQQPTMGTAPCYVTVDKNGKNIMIANFGGGNIAAYPVQSDGKLGPPSDSVQHKGSGADKKRQSGPHAHCIVLDPTSQYAFVADLGLDQVLIYKFNGATGKFTPSQPPHVSTRPGAGPRHFTFHPNGKFAFVINELNNTITTFAYTQKTGALKVLESVSTLPADFKGESYCADIHVSADGKFIYGSNRGHNSIAVFGVNPSTGKLTPIQHQSTQGKWPRNFAIDPSGKILLVANQQSDSVVSYKIDNKTGKLTPTKFIAEVGSPVCLRFMPTVS
jgi:6-phosphogluconolactonase